MRIRRTSLLEGARAATGVVVTVDVYRAFTTAAFCLAAGAREIVLLRDAEEALAIKATDPNVFLTGEVTIVALGDGARAEDGPEDEACADLLEDLLLDRPGRRPHHLIMRPGWAEHGLPDWFPRRDAELACEVDRFDFALPVHREEGLLVARPARPT